MQIGSRGFDAIPPVVKNILIVNALFFFAQFIFANNQSFNLNNWFALHDIRSAFFKPHQLVTHMFMHANFGHIFFNMLAVWMFGSSLENFWGGKRFLIFYVLCGLGAAVLHLGVSYVELTPYVERFNMLPAEQQAYWVNNPEYVLNVPMLGASGAVFGILAAFAYLFPNTPIYLYFLFPIKAKWLMLIYGGLELYMGLRNAPGDSVAHWAHIGGAIVGILVVLYWNKTNRRTFY